MFNPITNENQIDSIYKVCCPNCKRLSSNPFDSRICSLCRYPELDKVGGLKPTSRLGLRKVIIFDENFNLVEFTTNKEGYLLSPT